MMRPAIIGLGMVSQTYGDALRNSKSVSLESVYARSPESRALFLKEWPDLEATAADSIAEIATSDVDFVILTTPPNARADIVETLAIAGKPILERPTYGPGRRRDVAVLRQRQADGQDPAEKNRRAVFLLTFCRNTIAMSIVPLAPLQRCCAQLATANWSSRWSAVLLIAHDPYG